MRDHERTLEKPPRGLRVALVGNSQTESKEVPLGSTWGQLLERRLQASLASRQVEVLNLGVSGYGTVASAIRFEQLGARFGPDLVLYLFVDNDPADNIGRDRQLYSIHDGHMEFRALGPSGHTPWRYRVNGFLKCHVQAHSFLKFRLQQIAGGEARRVASRGAPGPEVPQGPSEEAWLSTRLAIERLGAAAAGIGSRFVVLQGSSGGPEMTRRLGEICGELAVPFHDLLPALRQARGPLHYNHDGHWRSAGHEVAAEAGAAALAAWLPRPEAPPAAP